MGNGDNVLEDKENTNREQSWQYKRKICKTAFNKVELQTVFSLNTEC